MCSGEKIEHRCFQADKKFLESKPTCFVLFGKPGVGKTALARKLADDWHAELINSKFQI